MTLESSLPLLPAGSCDCHSHIYLPQAEYLINAGHVFEEGAGIGEYNQLCEALGVTRHVIVQSKAYSGPEAVFTAMEQLGTERCRGLLFAPVDVDQDRLDAWNRSGVRGFRFLFPSGTAIDFKRIASAAEVAASFGWHLIVQAQAEALSPHYRKLLSLPATVVIDHIGRLPKGTVEGNRHLDALVGFVADGGWVKIAAPYNVTPEGRSSFSSLSGIIRSLISACADRCIWGINFPHPNLPYGQKPEERSTLRSLLALLSPVETMKIFVENPERLYGFPTHDNTQSPNNTSVNG